MKKYNRLIILISIVGILIVAALFASPKLQRGFFNKDIFIQKIPITNNSLEQSNAEVIKLKENYEKKITTEANLKNALIQRKEKMASLIKENPDEANRLALSTDFRKNLPKDIQQFVESQEIIEGTLQMQIFDDFTNKTTRTNYYIYTDQGEKIQIHTAKKPKINPGTRIKINGIFLKNVGLATRDNFQIINNATLERIGPSRVLVTLVGLDTISPRFEITPALIYGRMFFDSNNSVKSFYKRNSFNNIILEGNVSETTITLSQSFFPNLDNIVEITDSYIDFGAYDYYLFVYMENSCSGYATIGKQTYDTDEGIKRIGVSHVSSACFFDINKNTFHHEIGHNLGIKHADGWSCNNDIPTNELTGSNTCIVPYDDDSVMGNGAMTLGPFQKNKMLGAMSPIKSKTVTTNGDYYLYPTNSAINRIPDQYQEIQVPSINGYYSLEYRTDSQNEVVIRFAPSESNEVVSEGGGNATDTLRLRSSTYSLRAISPNKNSNFIDRLRNLSISVMEFNNDRVLLHIEN